MDHTGTLGAGPATSPRRGQGGEQLPAQRPPRRCPQRPAGCEGKGNGHRLREGGDGGTEAARPPGRGGGAGARLTTAPRLREPAEGGWGRRAPPASALTGQPRSRSGAGRAAPHRTASGRRPEGLPRRSPAPRPDNGGGRAQARP